MRYQLTSPTITSDVVYPYFMDSPAFFSQRSSMAAQTNIPPDLSDADRNSIFQSLDTDLNSRILYSLLTGFYTGVTAVTLWNIFTNKSRPIARAMVVVITLLYIVTIIDFAFIWSNVPSIFVHHGQNFLDRIFVLRQSRGQDHNQCGYSKYCRYYPCGFHHDAYEMSFFEKFKLTTLPIPNRRSGAVG